MVVDCSKCVDTGKLGEETYCECPKGQLAKRIDRGKRKAERMAEKEREEKKQKAQQMELLPKLDNMGNSISKDMPFAIGDYVKVTKSGYSPFFADVIDIDRRNSKFQVSARSYVSGSRATGELWANSSDLELVSHELTENEVRGMIDIALDARDKVWFDELSQKLASY